MLKAVIGNVAPDRVLCEPVGNPLFHRFGLQVARHVLGLVDGVHEGDAGLYVNVDVVVLSLAALSRAAHGQRKGESAQIVSRRQPAPPDALGVLCQEVRRIERRLPVDTDRDDAVVRKPAVTDGFHVTLAVQLHAERGLVVHRADNPILVSDDALAVVDARRGGLIDAVRRRKAALVVADGEIVDALFLAAHLGGVGVPALQPGGAMRLVRYENTRPNAPLQQRLRHPCAALVRADENLYGRRIKRRLAHPVGNLAGVSGHPALDFRLADVADVEGGVERCVAAALFLWVETHFGIEAGGFVGADGEDVQVDIRVLQILAPYLRHQRDGWAENDGHLARRRQFFDDPQRNARLASAARQDDSAARLTLRRAAAVRIRVLLEDADACGDGVVLHTGLGLNGVLVGRVVAVGATLVVRRPSVQLPLQVVVDVEELERLPPRARYLPRAA